MKKYKYHIFSLVSALVMVAMFNLIISTQIQIAQATGSQISITQRALTSSGVLINTSSTLLIATTTNRQYLRISNLAGQAIYCTPAVGGTASSTFSAGPAIAYQGITIYASSTYQIVSDENPYTGPVYCIAPSGTASTTVVQF